jgi:hypothetical protein
MRAIGRLVIDIIYGAYQGELSVIDPVTTSQINLASLYPIGVHAEVGWHMRGLINNGGTVKQIETALGVARDVCKLTGVEIKTKMPTPEEVIGKQNLI